MSDELIEKAVRAILIEKVARAMRNTKCTYEDEARAAIAVVVEECAQAFAKFSDETGRQECCGNGIQGRAGFDECCCQPLLFVNADAGEQVIRSLAKDDAK